MMLLPGIRLERGENWSALAFDRERPVLSSAPVGGGDVRARRVVNLCVDGPDARVHCDDPGATFARLAGIHGWSGRLVGLMTGVAAERLGIARADAADRAWAAVATAGVSNAHRAGDPMATPGALHDDHGPGTINVVAVTSRGLTPAARAEAVALVAEAKAGLLADLGITAAVSGRIATGTGTDAIAIVGADGDDTPYTGYHTRSGQQLVAAVREALQRSLHLDTSAHPPTPRTGAARAKGEP